MGYLLFATTASNNIDVSGNHSTKQDLWLVKLIDSTTGVHPLNLAAPAIKVYPTLTTGVIKIEMPQGYENADVRLLNILGQEIKLTADNNGRNKTLYINNAAEGMYLLQIVNEGLQSTFKIVYQH